MRQWILIGISGFLIGAAPPQKRRVPTPRVQAGSTAASPGSYQQSVANLNTCADLAATAASPPNARPLLDSVRRSAFIGQTGAVKKDEFETSAAYELRSQSFWRRALGDPQKLIFPFDKNRLTAEYDADSGTLNIKYLFDSRAESVELVFRDSVLDKSNYTAKNAYGAQVAVRSIIFGREYLNMPKREISGTSGISGYPEWKLAMSIDDARSFKANPKFIVWAEFNEPYLSSEGESFKPTFDNPRDFTILRSAWSAHIRCLFAVSNSRVIATLIDRDAEKQK